MATLVNGSSGSFAANLAVSAYRGVVLSNNGGITYSGATDIPLGFTEEDAASGDYVSVRFFNAAGTQKCEVTAQPVTVADTLYAGALGRASTTGTITWGKSRTTTQTNTEVIEFAVGR
jgi:hypothetical protein